MRQGKETLCAALVLWTGVSACGARSGLLDDEERLGDSNVLPPVDDDGGAGGQRSRREPKMEPDPAPPKIPGPPGDGPEPPDPVPVSCENLGCADDGNPCNGREVCDLPTGTCIHLDPLLCDDGLVCNGEESCDPERGCVPGTAMECAGNSQCDEATARCLCDEPYLAPECAVKTAYFADFGRVWQLTEQSGILWVATSTGLYAVDHAGSPSQVVDDAWTRFERIEGFADGGGMAFDGSGPKWFAPSYGMPLMRLDDAGTALDQQDDEWTYYEPERVITPRSIAVDDAGAVWLGSFGQTMVFSDGGTPDDRADDRWQSLADLGAPETLSELSNVDSIIAHPSGSVWLGSSSGGLWHYSTSYRRFVEPVGFEGVRVTDLGYHDLTFWIAERASESTATIFFALSSGMVGQQEIAGPVERITTDPEGRVFVVRPDGGLSCFERTEEQGPVETLELYAGPEAARVVEPRNAAEVWIGTDDGVLLLEHGGSCSPEAVSTQRLVFEQGLRSAARDVEVEGEGLWFATDGGVDFLDSAGTPFDKRDDRWAHFDEKDVSGLSGLQGVVIREDGLKLFWGNRAVFALDDGGTPFSKGDDRWVAHATEHPLWVSGVVDTAGRLLVVGRSMRNEESAGPRIVAFDPGPTPTDPGDDVVVTLFTGLQGMGRSMAVDSAGEIWLGTEASNASGNLHHWDRADTPLDDADDVWTPVRPQQGRVWKLVADPTGGIWGTAGGGVFHFFDGGTPTNLSDDSWTVYPSLGSAMEVGSDGNGWFRVPGGAAILDVNGTPRDSSDDQLRDLAAPDALRFPSDLYTNGTVDEQGRFWIADEHAQVFEPPE